MYGVGDGSGWRDSSIETYRPSYDCCRRRGIARHHDGADAQRAQLRYECRRIGSRRIAESDDSRELHCLRRSHRDGQHPEALCLQLIRYRGRIGRCFGLASPVFNDLFPDLFDLEARYSQRFF